MTTFSNSITLGNIITIGTLLVSLTLAYGRLAANDETLGLRISTQEVSVSAQLTRLGQLEAQMNGQAVGFATLTAQFVSVRETLNEMKSSQAETNMLLRNLSLGRPAE